MIIRVAVAVDTGMHRIGIKSEDAVEFIKRVESYENLEVDGFFSHMSNADAADQSHAHVLLRYGRRGPVLTLIDLAHQGMA